MSGDKSVTDRFFEVYDDLILTGQTNRMNFCKELGIDKRNFYQQEKDHTRRIIRFEWLSHIVLNYGVSADWLLTGRGWPYGE